MDLFDDDDIGEMPRCYAGDHGLIADDVLGVTPLRMRMRMWKLQ